MQKFKRCLNNVFPRPSVNELEETIYTSLLQTFLQLLDGSCGTEVSGVDRQILQ